MATLGWRRGAWIAPARESGSTEMPLALSEHPVQPLVEFFDLAMMRRAMLGIKQRAETAPKS